MLRSVWEVPNGPAGPVIDGISSRHVVLVGAMGSGKTTIGRLVASRLSRPFLDNDIALRATTGEDAADLLRERGVDVLHAREAAILESMLEREDRSVIAAAASTIDDPAAREAMRAHAFVVWLRGDPRLLARRAETSPHRPFLDDEALLLELAGRRASRYQEAADLVVDADGPPEAIADAVTTALT